MNAVVKDSGHWYAQDGSPAYTQPNASKPGESRPTTIRDAKKLDLVPSVTGIINMAAKPALERWKLQQLMMSALTLPAVDGESVSDYEARLWEDSNAQAKEARDKGTEIHGYIESFFVDGSHADNPYVDAVSQAICFEFGPQEWLPEKSFARLGFGGKVDLHSKNVVIDYKTKDFTEKDMFRWKKDGSKGSPVSFTYIENKMQLSAYRKGLNLPDAIIANVYIARELQEDGTALVKVEIHTGDNWPEFECLLKYWKLIKGIK